MIPPNEATPDELARRKLKETATFDGTFTSRYISRSSPSKFTSTERLAELDQIVRQGKEAQRQEMRDKYREARRIANEDIAREKRFANKDCRKIVGWKSFGEFVEEINPREKIVPNKKNVDWEAKSNLKKPEKQEKALVKVRENNVQGPQPREPIMAAALHLSQNPHTVNLDPYGATLTIGPSGTRGPFSSKGLENQEPVVLHLTPEQMQVLFKFGAGINVA